MMWGQAAGDLATRLFVVAADVAPGTSTDALWVPGGMFLTAAGLLFKASTTYKEARQIDVKGAEDRERKAESELEDARRNHATELDEVRRQRDEAKADRDQQINELKDRVSDLSTQVTNLDRQINELRTSHMDAIRDMQESHAAEVAGLMRRLEREIRVAYRIREVAAARGISIEDDILDADHGLDQQT